MARGNGRRLLAGLTVVLSTVGCSVVAVAVARSAWAVAGQVVVQQTSALTGSESSKRAFAQCPAGTRVLGGGADIIGGGNRVHVSWMEPVGSFNGYLAVAYEDSRGYDGSWTVTAFAVCGQEPSGWEIVATHAASVPGDRRFYALVACPAGKKALGIGGGTFDHPEVFVLETLVPNGGDLDDVIAWVDHDSTPVSPEEQFTVSAFAICVDPLPEQQMVYTYNSFSHGDQTARIDCPAGTRVYGGGFQMVFGGGEVHLDRLGFYGAERLGGVDADARLEPGGDGMVADGWYLGVFATCAA